MYRLFQKFFMLESEEEYPKYTKEFLGRMVEILPDAVPTISQFCSNIPLSKIKKVIATSFYKIKFGDKTFYLFGEQHSHPNMCPPAKDVAFVDTLVKSVTEAHKDRKYDLFFELPVKKDVEEMEEQLQSVAGSFSVHLIMRRFYHLITLKNRKKDVNLRVHYADFRRSVSNADDDKMVKFYKNPDRTSMLEIIEILRERLSSAKIAKQVDAIKDPAVKTLVQAHVQSELYRINSALKMFKADEEDNDDDAFLNSMSLGIIRKAATSLMDVYTITRMLRSFDDYDSTHIIFHGGAMHTRNLKEFFENIIMFASMGMSSLPRDYAKIEMAIEVPDAMCLEFDAQKIFE
jgi:hypothetical protein